MLRLRWYEREPADQATPTPWAHAAMITATLFLNFPFWIDHGFILRIPGSILRNVAFSAAAVALMAALAFAGPALMCQAAKRPFFGAIRISFGSVPAAAIRLCCALFLTAWIADLVSFPASRFITFILRRDVSETESAAVATALVVYLFATALQSHRIHAKLAFFINKLAFAILLAALIRARDGLPATLQEVPNFTAYSAASAAWHSLSELTLYTMPLFLLAAIFGHRLATRRDAVLTGAMGVALPLFGTVLLTYLIGFAAHGNVAKALWGGAAHSAEPPRMMFVVMTIFGAVRFGAMALEETVRSRISLAVFAAIVVWCSLLPSYGPEIFEISAKCLVVVAAIMTADFVSGRRDGQARKVDWVGCGALAAGLAVGFGWHSLIDDSLTNDWWHPRVLPSYAVAYFTCLAGRLYFRFRNSPGES